MTKTAQKYHFSFFHISLVYIFNFLKFYFHRGRVAEGEVTVIRYAVVCRFAHVGSVLPLGWPVTGG